MTRSYDHRQLVAAHGKLANACEELRWALFWQGKGDTSEPGLRVVYAIREAEAALVDLRRFARRHGETP